VLGGVGALVLVCGGCGVSLPFVVAAFWSAPAPSAASIAPPPGQPELDDEPPGPPPFAVDPKLKGAEGVVYLTDLQEYAVRMGPWNFGKGGRLGNPENSPISVADRPSPHGLGMHPPGPPHCARVCYALGGRAAIFKTAVGYNDYKPNPACGPARFEVVGDGRLLWRSQTVKERNVLQQAELDVSGVQVLEVRVCGEGYMFGSHAVWFEPRLYTDRAAAGRDDR
jgi:hypothetical protein